MKFARAGAIAHKQFRTLRHDPRTLALMLLAPVMAMVVFGFVFGNAPKNIPIVVVNQDRGPLAQKLISHIDRSTLAITFSRSVDVAKNEVLKGQAVAAVIFDPTFTKRASPSMRLSPGPHGKPEITIVPPAGAQAEVFVDTTNQQLADAVVPALASAGQKLASATGSRSPISFATEYAFSRAKDARYIDYFVPGIMAFAITLFTTLLTLLAFVGERANGTLERLRVSPVTEAEIVLGYEMAFGLIAAVQGALILAVAMRIYHVLVVGPLWVAGLIVILTAIDAQAIGILVSSAARRESQAIQFIPFIIFPIFLLSGVFVAVESLPSWLRPFSYLLPPTWGIDGLRDVMLRGWGLSQVWLILAVLAGFTILFTGLAIVGLRRARD